MGRGGGLWPVLGYSPTSTPPPFLRLSCPTIFSTCMSSTLLVPHVVYVNGVYGDHEHNFICYTAHISPCRSRLKPDHLPRFLCVYVCPINTSWRACVQIYVATWTGVSKQQACALRFWNRRNQACRYDIIISKLLEFMT